MFEMVFLYAGIPAMFSLYAIIKEKEHDTAGIMWIIISIIFLPPYAIGLSIIGIIIGTIEITIQYENIIKKLKQKITKHKQ